MDERRIVLGMPGYGRQSAGAGRSFWHACRDMSRVWNYYQCGSLLASNFNQLWCLALNLSHAGERVDYFAMLHDDVSADDYWLDTMIAELEDNHLDILGAVVPIKDTRGMTSLALDGDDNWLPFARLSMHDIYELPETFTSADLANKPLLINTGCFVVKWNQDWCRQVRFEINDRIVFNRACNRYQAQTEPEDWYFSRLCHEIGLRIGATRKVAIRHQGDMEFSNTMPWGSQKFDYEAVKVSPVPGAFPADIAGWLHRDEANALTELATGKRVLEIGSYCGLSTVCLARSAESVVAVDFFDGRGTPHPQSTRAAFEKNIERYGVKNKVRVEHPSWFESSIDERFDLVFIDGAHDTESVQLDCKRAMSVLDNGGLLLFHDFSSNDPEVMQVVQELLAEGGELLQVTNTLALVRPPSPILLEV